MRYLRVKNWKRHQHGTKGGLPWIKLYTDLLAPTKSPAYAQLADAAKLLLHHIWLMASVFSDHIPDEWVSREKLNVQSRVILEPLISSGFIYWEDESTHLTCAHRASELLNSEYLSSETHEATTEFQIAFAALWADYPRPKGRRAALKAFSASVQTPEDLADIRRALDAYRAEIARLGTEERFIKHGSTWFNNWRDYVPPKPSPEALAEAAQQARIDAIRDSSPINRATPEAREWLQIVTGPDGTIRPEAPTYDEFLAQKESANG